MRFSKVYSAQTSVVKATIIDIEVDLLRGLHSFSIVGLPDKAVEESRDRVSAAIKNSGFDSPKSKNQKVVISLAPADIKKEGPTFDLGIALAYLLSSEDIKFDPSGKIFLGELSLDGVLRPIKGVLPLVMAAKDSGFKEIFLPEENAREAALIDGVKIFSAKTLTEVINHLRDAAHNEDGTFRLNAQPKTNIEYKLPEYTIDMSDVKGQEGAKRGLEIAAAGRHNIALFGPPGVGKTMLAKAFCGLLPPLPFDEILEVTSIHSVSGKLDGSLVTHPPLRSPHHTSSYVAMVGGGAVPKPGEVTLAHRGVLFLDEFPEFDRRVVESLRQPLEDGVVSVSRAKGSAIFPARMILIAAMNPCPCGNLGSTKECTCTPVNLVRYKRKLSGPIVDRIDMWTEVGEIEHEKLSDKSVVGEKSEKIRERVKNARDVQKKRFYKSPQLKTNSDMGVRELADFVELDSGVIRILNLSASKLGLSARAYHRVIKLARTIADLEQSENVKEGHVLEALQYRPKQLSASSF